MSNNVEDTDLITRMIKQEVVIDVDDLIFETYEVKGEFKEEIVENCTHKRTGK